MTREGWRECAIEAVRRADAGEPAMLDLLARLLEQQDDAKEALRRKGYGCIGRPWPDVVLEVPGAWF
jgi:hypothetical protein